MVATCSINEPYCKTPCVSTYMRQLGGLADAPFHVSARLVAINTSDNGTLHAHKTRIFIIKYIFDQLRCRTHTHTHTARMHLIACICYTFRRKYVSNVFNMIELINAAIVLNMVYNFVYTFDYTIIINFAVVF